MTRIFKPDSGQDLKFQNNGGTGSVNITDASDLTIDSPADIILDVDGADVKLKDGGVQFGTLKQSSGHLVIQPTSSKEIILNEQAGTASLTVDTSSQNVSINNGNLVIPTADKGISFTGGTDPDTTGSATGNALTDYEEGTFSATVADASSGGNEGGAYSGYYTKTGRLVTISFGFFNIDTVGLTSGNDLYFTGLPFPSGAMTHGQGHVGSCAGCGIGSGWDWVSPVVSPSTSVIRLAECVSGSGFDWIEVGEVTNNSADMMVSVTYFV